jgi:AraC-like DNA-binding protein
MVNLTVRSTWLSHTVATLQALVGTWAGPEISMERAVALAIRGLPPAQNRAEALLQRALFLQLLLCHNARRWPVRSASDVAFLRATIEELVTAPPYQTLPSLLRDSASVRVESSAPDALTKAVREFIDARFAEPLTMAQIAAAINVDRRLIQSSFARHMGRSIRAYIGERRIAAALEYLTQNNEKVEAVAFLVGYRSRKNFNAAMNRFIRMTPSDVRTKPAEAWLRFRRVSHSVSA